MLPKPLNTIRIVIKTTNQIEEIFTAADQNIVAFRALVAAKFEIELKDVILIYAGQILADVGKLDQYNITDSVTVHLVIRKKASNASPLNVQNMTLAKGEMKSKNNAAMEEKCSGKLLLPLLLSKLHFSEAIKTILFKDPNIDRILTALPNLRHMINNTNIIKDVTSILLSPARMAEYTRKNDLNLLRLELMPGGTATMQRTYFLLNESLDSFRYKKMPKCKRLYPNPQRGLENRMPLPNPWTRSQVIRKSISSDIIKFLGILKANQAKESTNKGNFTNVRQMQIVEKLKPEETNLSLLPGRSYENNAATEQNIPPENVLKSDSEDVKGMKTLLDADLKGVKTNVSNTLSTKLITEPNSTDDKLEAVNQDTNSSNFSMERL